MVCEAQGGADISWGSRGHPHRRRARPIRCASCPPGAGAEPATRHLPRRGEVGRAWPCFLPDGERFLFIGNRTGAGDGGNIRLGKLGSLDSKLLGRSDGRVEYAPGGWVLYLKGSTLLAQQLDPGAAKLTGQPLTIAENVRTGSSAGHFSISRTGVLAYARGDATPPLALHEADRTGRLAGPVLATGLLANPAVSPDGGRLLFERKDGQSAVEEIWVRDLKRGTETKLTIGGAGSRMPVWSPDGRRFACAQSRAQTGARSCWSPRRTACVRATRSRCRARATGC